MSRVSIHLFSLTVLAIVLLPGAAQAQDDEMGAAPPAANEEPGTLDILNPDTGLGNVTQTAMGHYHAGHRSLARAMKLEEKLDETDPSKREKALAKVDKAYEEAANEYLQAIRSKPDLLDAYTELGQAFRALGKHSEAVQIHSAALNLAPEDADNLYGRGEAFLALNYLKEAATTYTELVGKHDEHAAKLMASLKKWVADRRANPGDIRPDAIETFAAWIDQQQAGSG